MRMKKIESERWKAYGSGSARTGLWSELTYTIVVCIAVSSSSQLYERFLYQARTVTRRMAMAYDVPLLLVLNVIIRLPKSTTFDNINLTRLPPQLKINIINQIRHINDFS